MWWREGRGFGTRGGAGQRGGGASGTGVKQGGDGASLPYGEGPGANSREAGSQDLPPMASPAPQLRSLFEEFSCPVCLDWLQDPVTLPCGHVYCQGCIETTWGTLGVPPACPECREPCPDRRYAPCRLWTDAASQRVLAIEGYWEVPGSISSRDAGSQGVLARVPAVLAGEMLEGTWGCFPGDDLPRVTLDPATAHPCLVLSEDRTWVRDGPLRRPLPDTPARFDFCVAVLGAGAFASGRRYWEVEVGEKPAWTLGVVHASVSRKGKIHASPSKGFWVIRLRGRAELMAKDTPPMVLHPQALPHRIGVYLDYEGGQVSFYDAQGMAHLYTFSTRFAESVYPYFCPGLYDSGGNATPLKICPLP
uniref:Uncharacterized protein n=1 Tax=Chrysemys picta bellii TaxID=8478 RepID=A0A8C3FV63_CHRPI